MNDFGLSVEDAGDDQGWAIARTRIWSWTGSGWTGIATTTPPLCQEQQDERGNCGSNPSVFSIRHKAKSRLS